MTTTDSENAVSEIVSAHPGGRETLIPILHDIQKRLGYLSREALSELAAQSGISENEIYGTATFYSQFRFLPQAEHLIRVCTGTACYAAGGEGILLEFEKQLGIKTGQSTRDGKIALRVVDCLGCCAHAPVIEVDGRVRGGISRDSVSKIIKELIDENPVVNHRSHPG